MAFTFHHAQTGLRHRDGKPPTWFGAGVLEVVSHHDGDTSRAVCMVRFETTIHGLDAFQKKAKRGIATLKKQLDRGRHRLPVAERHNADAQGRGTRP